MSESDSLGSSAASDAADPFGLIASVGRPIPQFGLSQPMVVGSFGLAPTPPIISEQVVKCPLCLEAYREPKVLACFHSFCRPCLERQLDLASAASPSAAEKLVCPQCNMETQLSVQLGIDSLLSDYGLESVLSRQLNIDDKGLIFGSPSSTSSSPPLSDSPPGSDQLQSGGSVAALHHSCTGCKSGERASAFCQDCTHFLCTNCTMAHQYMHCFEGHRVEQLSASTAPSMAAAAASASAGRTCMCLQHRMQPLRFFCLSCNLAICRECTLVDHPAPAHQYEPISEVADKQMSCMEALVNEARGKHAELLDMFKAVDGSQQRLTASAERARAVLDESTQAIVRLLDEQRKHIAKEIDQAYSSKQLQLTMVDKRIQQMSDKLSQTIEFTSRLVKYASPTEVMVFKQLLDTRLRLFLDFNPDVSSVLTTPCELELPPMNTQLARQHVQSLMGQVRGVSEWGGVLPSAQTGMPPTPIGRPPSRQQLGRSPQQPPPAMAQPPPVPQSAFASDSNLLRPKHDFGGSSQSLGPFSTDVFSAPAAPHSYEKWSSALEPSLGLIEPTDMDAVDKANSLYPPSSRSQIKRQKMIYHCKFGEFGVMEGQFTEPSGVAVNAQHDIVVADTNNHRIQVFDKEGRFKFQFGECGKRDGQLLYPNRVAVNKMTGDFVVTERSPTHQIQVYNQYGQFLRKFGANILQHPRGVCVDSKGRIIVVECKVMRVIIFDMFGNILQKFSCSRYLEFPNGVCTNEKNEILISDNRAHCIKVFSYEGQFLRQIGGEGVTNYPIGVGINSMGEVVVADNHNNFNLTVFSQDGTMIGALESKVKHAQCFDVALVDDGSVVLASKDYRLYLYRFQPGGAPLQ